MVVLTIHIRLPSNRTTRDIIPQRVILMIIGLVKSASFTLDFGYILIDIMCVDY